MIATVDRPALEALAALNQSGGEAWSRFVQWLKKSDEDSTRVAIDSHEEDRALEAKYEARAIHSILNAIETANRDLRLALDNEQAPENTFA